MRLNPEDVRNKYNRIDEIWNPSDRWSMHTKREIEAHVDRLKQYLISRPNPGEIRILNAGSGGNDYGLSEYSQVHVDIADKRIAGLPNSIVASVEHLPFPDRSFDCCLCVGSVINYCDALKALAELSRILVVDGLLLLEFESSRSYEFLFKKSFNSSATIVETFYNGNKDKTWVYAPEYIFQALAINGLQILDKTHFHLISPLIYKITGKERFSARFSILDRFARALPFLGTLSANIILTCQKICQEV